MFFPKFLTEKWEWELEVFPIDHADIRTCVLESVSKIAQETWMHLDKQNFGMGYAFLVQTCLFSHFSFLLFSTFVL